MALKTLGEAGSREFIESIIFLYIAQNIFKLLTYFNGLLDHIWPRTVKGLEHYKF